MLEIDSDRFVAICATQVPGIGATVAYSFLADIALALYILDGLA